MAHVDLPSVDQMRDTATARVDLDADGVVTVRIQPGVYQSMANAEENLFPTRLFTAEGRAHEWLKEHIS